MNKFNHIYFIGIGGISMSALAEIMIDEGCKVSGSDRNNSHIIKRLEVMGAKININHNSENVTADIDLVVYTSAIANDNPELLRAQELKLNIMDRAEFLGYIMKNYSHSICVSGTHGKTTTTGMLSSILLETDLEPTIFLGGEMDAIGGNLRQGSYNLMLTESCEYKRNFLKFNPTMEIILNIEADHLDYYKDLADVESAFVEYAGKLPKDGFLIVNIENAHLFKDIKTNTVTFGKDEKADYYAGNINMFPTPSFALMQGKNKVMDIELKVLGEHNILNATAAAAACISLGIAPEDIRKGLLNFKGTHRRFEYKGSINGAQIIDDYAHHPTEMKATLTTAREYSKGKIITVFQPHTYSRTKALLGDFADALCLSDKVILLDIYAAREKNNGEIHSKDIIKEMNELSKEGLYAENFEKAAEMVKDMAAEGDTIIAMGAGNVNEIIPLIQN
jgi:UDP-N-acetylmuramate--alanine ligase